MYKPQSSYGGTPTDIEKSLEETHWFCEICQAWVIKSRPCPKCGSFGGGK